MSRNVDSASRFVILTSGRSGSSWLMEMLNSHPEIGGYGELFSSRFRSRFPQTRAASYGDPGGIPFFGAALTDHRIANPLTMPVIGTRYLNGLYEPRHGLRALGFRMRYGQLGIRWGGIPVGSWFLPYAALRRVRIVHLIRRNHLDFLLSRDVATVTGLRHARSDQVVTNPRIAIDTDTLLRRIEQCEAHERLVKRAISVLRLPAHEISYEDLRSNTAAAYGPVLEFLGVRADHQPQWGMRKVIDTPRNQLIENYEGVRQTLAGTKYASFLD